tara:strand:+ start:188 stop:697 length:510 start_codon:yes stop_codon:yes gene_type:complete
LALYELSQEKSEVDKNEDAMKNLKNLLISSKDFKETILNPIITKEDKSTIISEIGKSNNFSDTLKNFLGFVSKKNRLFFLDKIIESFLNLVSKNKGQLKAKLISSKILTADEQKNIQKELSKDFKSELNIEYRHDPSLIAGLIIQVGSIMIDTSIKTKLQRLERSMIEA